MKFWSLLFKNIRKRTIYTIFIVIIIAMAVVIFSLLTRGKSIAPFDDKVSDIADTAQDVSGDGELYISIRLNEITVNGEIVRDNAVNEVVNRARAASESGSKVILVDDYALNDTYTAIENELLKQEIDFEKQENNIL